MMPTRIENATGPPSRFAISLLPRLMTMVNVKAMIGHRG